MCVSPTEEAPSNSVLRNTASSPIPSRERFIGVRVTGVREERRSPERFGITVGSCAVAVSEAGVGEGFGVGAGAAACVEHIPELQSLFTRHFRVSLQRLQAVAPAVADTATANESWDV